MGGDPDQGEASLFQAEGTGELGRLMAKYIYWSIKEGKGWSEANKPVYEKDLWDAVVRDSAHDNRFHSANGAKRRMIEATGSRRLRYVALRT